MSARAEAERALAALREEIARTRRALEQEPMTADRLDALEAALDRRLAALPRPKRRPSRAVAPAAPRAWAIGDLAHARSSGWSGRVVAIERDGASIALQAGDLRVMVDRDDLEPATAGEVARAGEPARPRAGRRGDFGPPGPRPAATAVDRGQPSAAPPGDAGGAGLAVPASLDLRGARVDEALETLDRYLDRASLAGAGRVTVIHGHGTGAMRDAVRAVLDGHPLVKSWRPGDRGEGGDGVSVVSL